MMKIEIGLDLTKETEKFDNFIIQLQISWINDLNFFKIAQNLSIVLVCISPL
jgi:hypothetical protein